MTMRIKIVLILGFAILLASCQSNKKPAEINQVQIPMAKKIKINELPDELNKLKNGQTEFNFIGITSNGIDCIYFVYENGKFDIEFEAMDEQQIPFIKKIEVFADANDLKTTIITYNNKPHFKSENPAPVIKIKANFSLQEIANLGTKIQSELFNNTNETVYEVVP